MPTPDTETLAARLRAVERALTDETADLEPDTDRPGDDTPDDDTPDDRSTDDGSSEDVDPGAADEPQDSGEQGRSDLPDETRRRLRRLEATVQALKAALDGDPRTAQADSAAEPSPKPSAGTESRSTDPEAAESLSEDPRSSVPTRRHRNRDRRDRSAPGDDWPDDLATE